MVQKLKDKHPDLRDPVAFKAQLMSNNRVTSNTTLTPSDVANALRGMDRTTASGFGGWTVSLLRLVCGVLPISLGSSENQGTGNKKPGLLMITRYIQVMMNNTCPERNFLLSVRD
jgi:hypothetical protein